MTAAFDLQPRLAGDTLALRPIAADDRDDLFAAASAPETWAGHPAKERWKPEVFDPYFDFLIRAGGTLAILDRASGRMIGCSRYYVPPDQPDGIAVGFTFLDHAFWGGATNLAVKRLMLGHALAHFPAVWFHIDPTNRRSQVATGRLGAVHVYDATLDLAGRPAPWMCFRLDRADWERVLREREA